MSNTLSNTILVTSASGNVGRELVQQLKAAGVNVIAGSSSVKAVEGVKTRRVDFSDPVTLTQAFSGIDTLFLLFPLQANMAELARNALAAARAAGVKHIVRSSGAGANPAAAYTLPRVQGEIDRMVIESGIPHTLLLPNTFMQNFATYFSGMIQGGALYLPQGEGKTSYIDVRDIAAVLVKILQNPAAHAGQSYTLTGGEALSNAEAVALIATAIGQPVNYVAVPDTAAQESMRGMGMDEWHIAQLMSLHQLTAAGYAAGTSDAVQRLLGRAPIRFADFAQAYRSAWV